jgi:hypothetical protein
VSASSDVMCLVVGTHTVQDTEIDVICYAAAAWGAARSCAPAGRAAPGCHAPAPEDRRDRLVRSGTHGSASRRGPQRSPWDCTQRHITTRYGGPAGSRTAPAAARPTSRVAPPVESRRICCVGSGVLLDTWIYGHIQGMRGVPCCANLLCIDLASPQPGSCGRKSTVGDPIIWCQKDQATHFLCY